MDQASLMAPPTPLTWGYAQLTLEIIKLIILCVGLIGNTLTIVTVSKKQLWMLSVSRLLLALAISDTCYVLSQLPRMDLWPRISHYCVNKALCWFERTSHSVSHWLLVIVAIQRFSAVVNGKVKTILSISTTNVAIICTVTTSAAFCTVWVNFKVVQNGECQPPGEKATAIDKMISHAYAAICMMFPHAVMAILNMTTTVIFAKQYKDGISKDGNLTVVLMVTMTLSIVFTSPMCCVYIAEWNLVPVGRFVKRGSDVLFACSFAMSFVIYLGVWKRFRETFMRKNTVGPLSTPNPPPDTPQLSSGGHTVPSMAADNFAPTNADQTSTTSNV